jgi:hypothetical protein
MAGKCWRVIVEQRMVCKLLRWDVCGSEKLWKLLEELGRIRERS